MQNEAATSEDTATPQRRRGKRGNNAKGLQKPGSRHRGDATGGTHGPFTKIAKPGNATRQRDRMAPDPGGTRKRQIGGTQGSNENQKTKRSNENRRKMRPGERSEEDAVGRGRAPELHNRRPPEKRYRKDATGNSHSSVKRKRLPPGENGRLSRT